MIRRLFPMPDPTLAPRLVKVARTPPSGEMPQTRPAGEKRAWIVTTEGVRLQWRIFGVILVLTVLAELLVHLHPHFEIEGWFGFHAWFGFLGCVAMVLAARGLAVFLKRKDTFYDVVD
jgi:hypothetical protein